MSQSDLEALRRALETLPATSTRLRAGREAQRTQLKSMELLVASVEAARRSRG